MGDFEKAISASQNNLESVLGKEVAQGVIERASIGEEKPSEENFFQLLSSCRNTAGHNQIYILSRFLEDEGLSDIAEKARYWVIIQEMLDTETSLLSQEEVNQAVEDIEGLKSAEGCVVGIDRDPEAVLDDLLENFKGIQGDVAPFLIGRKLNNILLSDISIPNELESQM